MKKIISLAIFLAPLSASACVESESGQAVKNVILWISGFLLYGSVLTLIGYSILFFFTRIKRKKIIIFSVVMLIISILVIFYLYLDSIALCGSTSQF